MQQPTLLTRLGGDQIISELVDQFYYRALVNQKLQKYFVSAELAKVRFHQKVYFYNLFGGNVQYKGRDMKEIHKNLGIGNEEFDEFLMIIKELLIDKQVDEVLIKEVQDKLNSVRTQVVFKK